jgi:hypothetical protein
VSDAHDHTNHVNTWMGKAAKDASSEQLLQLFARVMGALWNRAHLTLGDVTLTAIVDRVLYTAAERFPPFESLKVGPEGIDFQKLREKREEISERELAAGVQFVIVEFMMVIGNLTAEILTPALQAELSKVTLKSQAPGGEPGKGQS